MKHAKFTVSAEDRQPRFVMTCGELWDNEEQTFWVRKPVAHDPARLIELLKEVRQQDFVGEMAWESAALRRWIRKVDKILDSVAQEKPVA